jgi:osmotically inducible lipoprotein OsmB
MIGFLQNKRTLAMFLSAILLLSTLGSLGVDAQRRSRRYYRRPHHSRLKGALIGAGVGTVGGAVIGGGKGAAIGAGAGAGTGYLIQRHRNRRHRHYRRY